MNSAGIFIMAASVGSVTVVFAWCLTRVLRSDRAVGDLAKVEPVGESQVDER